LSIQSDQIFIMKRILFFCMMIWNLLFGSQAQAQDWANREYYAQANIELQSRGADPKRVVLMGNSITEFWMETHPQFFADHNLVGRGISGQVSSQMLARFRQDVLNLQPRVVVINCGTNDIAENNGPYDEEITIDNILSMAELGLHNGITVVLSSVLPTDHFIWNPSVKDVPAKVVSLNRRIVDLAQRLSLPYIDYYSVMVVPGTGAINPAFSDDGVHPNPTGYDVMEKQLIETLEKLH
jgi:lysophospholipase L1-like esterase